MAKLNGLLILPSVLLFALIEPTCQHWLRRPQPYIAAIIALAIFSPFIWWNHTHGNAFWIHINAMGSRTEHHAWKFTLKYFGDFLGAQAGLLSPLIFLTYLWSLFKAARAPNTSPALRYCWSLSVVVFAVTILVSLKSRVEGNWAVASYLTGLILVANYMVMAWQEPKIRAWHLTSVGLAAVMTILIFATTFTSATPRIKFLDKRTDELYGWRDAANKVETVRQSMGGDPFIFGINYRIPSEMAFYLPSHPQTYSLFLHDRANEYMFWEDERNLIGRNAIMVNDALTPDHLDDCQAVFQHVVVAQPILIYRAPYKTPIRTLQVFRCYGFKGYSRQQWQDGW